MGCLGLNSDNLEDNWIFNSEYPNCSYTYHSGKGGGGKGRKWWSWATGGDSSSGNGGSSNSGGSSSGGGSSGGGGGGGGGGGNDDDGNESDSSDSGDGDDDAYLDTDDRAYDQTVSNEDFADVTADDDTYNYYYSGDDAADDQAGGGNADDNWDDDHDDYFNNYNDDAGNNNGNYDDYAADDYPDMDDDGGQQQNIEEANDDGYVTADFNPYTDFDVETCDTYENLWVWDLSLTCKTEGDLDQCECIFAEELIEEGYLSCGEMLSKCPADCRVCHTCSTLMGCPTNATAQVEAVLSSSPLVILVAAAGILCFGLVYYYARKRRRDDSEMAAGLMTGETGAEKVWLAPDTTPNEITIVRNVVGEDKSLYKDQPAKTAPTADAPNVWLVPDVPVKEPPPETSQAPADGEDTPAATDCDENCIDLGDETSKNLGDITRFMVSMDGPSYGSYYNESEYGSHHDSMTPTAGDQPSPGLGSDSMSTMGPREASNTNDSMAGVGQNDSMGGTSASMNGSRVISYEENLLGCSNSSRLNEDSMTLKKNTSAGSDDVVSLAEGQQVWLAPEVPVSAQFRPSHDAALALPHHPTDEHESSDEHVWLAPIV